MSQKMTYDNRFLSGGRHTRVVEVVPLVVIFVFRKRCVYRKHENQSAHSLGLNEQ